MKHGKGSGRCTGPATVSLLDAHVLQARYPRSESSTWPTTACGTSECACSSILLSASMPCLPVRVQHAFPPPC